ncbi:probable acyl-activating enzyme 17, peroxisomal [Zingiber officinale]|uniref:probable acyl-activating enzyme 17, peroxisomal n=1 Tax=Zingiber officinale TaxID=94328 RepID=UPI001C4A7D08|nr:probable acyl-activating enzyme 17, peroxisomal [Zingiber officinale]
MAYKAVAEVAAEEIAATGVPMEEAGRIHLGLRQVITDCGGTGPEAWDAISKRILSPTLPFPLHQMLYYGCYRDFGSNPPPAWIPDKENAASTNIGQVLQKHGSELLGVRYKDPISSFTDFQAFSVENPETYWKMVFKEMDISFPVPPSCILQSHDSYPGGQWLPGACLNSASLCLSLNNKRGLNDVAIIWRDEGCDALPVNTMTFKELRTKVWLIANALDTLGLPKESGVAIDMPMNVTSVLIYLAIVLAGYVVVSIADSFAPKEITTRLTIANAKAIFTQDWIIRGVKQLPLYSKVVEAHAPLAIVVPARDYTTVKGLRADDISWHDFLKRVDHTIDIPYPAVVKPFETFTNILFSSGTTGEPKAIPWTHATPLKASADAWAHMDIHKGDVVAWPTNLGWMMGPWLVYASLINGASMALYNGIPLGSGFAKFVQDAKVTMLGVVPSIVRAWKSTNCTAGLDWSTIRCFSSTGEASSVDDYLWLMGRAHYKPVIEYCGGTEIGGGFVSGSLLQPQALAAFSTPAMGCKLFILDSNGNPLPENSTGIGELALDPTMFGASTTLLNADHYDVYFKGMPMYNGKLLRRHGDEFERTAGGYYRAHGRADDTMNLGGIKVSSVEIERICNTVNEAILETAAIGVPPLAGGPEQLVVAVVFRDPNTMEDDLEKLRLAFNSALQKKLNPLFKVSSIVPVPSLPRTASNKVMRRILRQKFVNGPRL